ncbi:MAG: putative sporulation protein YtxC [Clostridiaceae bacterium]
MLLITLTYKKENSLLNKEINKLIAKYKTNGINMGISEKIENDIHILKLFSDNEEFKDKYIKSLKFYIARIVYHIMVENFNLKELKEFIKDNYFYLNSEDIKTITEKGYYELKSEEELDGESEIYKINKKNEIIKKILDCIEENDEFNLDGFLMFRKNMIYDDFYDIVDKSIEDYLIEKEYNEFIKLLRYFIEIQDSKIEEVNIFVKKDEGYIILDKEGEDIFSDLVADLDEVKKFKKIPRDDIIISGLISTAPKKIVIHSKERFTNKELIETIEKVFVDRVVYCNSCKLCRKLERQY